MEIGCKGTVFFVPLQQQKDKKYEDETYPV